MRGFSLCASALHTFPPTAFQGSHVTENLLAPSGPAGVSALMANKPTCFSYLPYSSDQCTVVKFYGGYNIKENRSQCLFYSSEKGIGGTRGDLGFLF